MAIAQQGGDEPRQVDEKEAFEHVGDAPNPGDKSPVPGIQSPEEEVLPSDYYTSWQFLGSYLAIIFTAIALFVSYTMPVGTNLRGQSFKSHEFPRNEEGTSADDAFSMNIGQQ